MRLQRHCACYSGINPREIFTDVYERRLWGNCNGQNYFSGAGSHNPDIVNPYVETIGTFLSSLSARPNVVDLGCGGFHVGHQIRPSCGRYIACDIVQGLIEWNKTTFAVENVDFRCLDILEERLPKGKIVFIRQVLQHLGNADVPKALKKT
jgi:SAM-dependent methyltransferase